MMGNMADGMGGHGMHTWEIGMGGHDTHIWLDKMGGGIFAKTAKTPPLQSGIGEDIIAGRIAVLERKAEYSSRRGTPRRYGLREMGLRD